MFKSIDIKNGKIKYWIDELPQMSVPNCLSVEDYVLSLCDKTFINTKVALEIFLHKNASYYGLLGVEYFPISESDSLKINISYTKKNELKYSDTILQYDDKVFLGLTEEYLDYTMKSIKKYLITSNEIQPGLLKFTVAANSEVGSSPKLFSVISEMLVELIIRINNKQYNDIEKDNIVKDVFYSSSLFMN